LVSHLPLKTAKIQAQAGGAHILLISSSGCKSTWQSMQLFLHLNQLNLTLLFLKILVVHKRGNQRAVDQETSVAVVREITTESIQQSIEPIEPNRINPFRLCSRNVVLVKFEEKGLSCLTGTLIVESC
jgi:hypothetical protein